MRRKARALVAACAVVSCLPAVQAAQPESLTLPQVLARVREHAPQVVAARLAIDEARGGLAGASLKLTSNPEIDAGVANRQGPDQRFTDVEIGLSQAFEPPSRRTARMAGAEAAIARSAADADEAVRLSLHAAATLFYRLVHAQERARLLGAIGAVRPLGVHVGRPPLQGRRHPRAGRAPRADDAGACRRRARGR